MSVLLVEDDPDIRAIAALGLGFDNKLDLAEADRGSIAMDYLRTAPAPDLILIDNSLPDMEGIELARMIREQHPSLHECLAFFTASVRDQDVERFLEAGARGVIRKPFDPLTLSSDVRRLLRP